MEIVHVQVRDVGTPAKRIPSATAGLASGYQRTNTTTMGVSAVANTSGYMLVEIATLPCYSPIPLPELSFPSELAHDEVEETPLEPILMDAERQKLELDITREFEAADDEASLLIDETK